MILRGLIMLAKGDKDGILEFGATPESFSASLAPLIAFPLVGAVMSAAGGQWRLALFGFLARLCAVLLLPVLVYEYARLLKRDPLWLRTATALNWSFWMVLPVLFVASFLGAILVQTGLAMEIAEYAAIGLAALYLLWYRWVILRAGLALSALQTILFLIVSSALIGVLTAAPMAVELLHGGHKA